MASEPGGAGAPADAAVEMASGAAQAAIEKVSEAIAAPDEFMRCLEEVGDYFASLEHLVEQLIHALSGKAADQHWGFRRMCRTVRDLLKLTGDEAYAANVSRWLGDCEEAAEERNDAIHVPHARHSRGGPQIGEGGKKTPVSVEQLEALKALKARIIALHSHGTVYKDELPEMIEGMARASQVDAGHHWEHVQMTKRKNMSRRSALKLGAAATALPLVHIRTAGAAGKLAIGFWDHWVPGGNDIMQKQVNAWADKNKVEVTADFITGNGNKLMMTGVAESQAKTGHDVYTFYNWDVYNSHDSLAPVDDVIKYLTGKYGAGERHRRVPGEAEGSLDGGAHQLRHADQATVRADRVVQEERSRRGGHVSRRSRNTPRRRTDGRGRRS